MPKTDEIWTIKKFALYDFDRDQLATVALFASFDAAGEAANRFDNVIVIPLVIQAVPAECDPNEKWDCEQRASQQG
jgi:hypothetical protein